jgi:hypothetical protein
MAKWKVVSYRPSFDRFDDDEPTEVRIIREFKTQDAAGKWMGRVKRAHKAMMTAGYPYLGGEFDGYQCKTNDNFFIAIGRLPFGRY